MVYDTSFQGNVDNRLRIHEEEYTNDLSTSLPVQVNDVIQSLIKETEQDFEQSQYMTTETQRKFLYQLVKLFGSSRILEIGTFTGVAAITMASALPSVSSITKNGENGTKNGKNGSTSKIVSLELDPKALKVARKHVEMLKELEDRVELILGPAMESLTRITKERPGEQYDFIFIGIVTVLQELCFDIKNVNSCQHIKLLTPLCFYNCNARHMQQDADKGGYISYFDFIMDHDLLTDNGVIIADNVLFYGQVHRQAGYADMAPIDFKRDIPGMAKQVHQFNEHVLKDPRVQVVMLPLFDGVSIITKNI